MVDRTGGGKARVMTGSVRRIVLIWDRNSDLAAALHGTVVRHVDDSGNSTGAPQLAGELANAA